MGITIKEIAELCGVSQGTVDRALNHRPGISEKTKKKILAVAAEHNYKPDPVARSLARGRTMTIGVVLFDLYNRSFSQLMNAIEISSREAGYYVHLMLTNKDPDNEKKCIEHLIHRKVDGIILFPINEGPEFDQYLHKLNIPIVTICNKVSEHWRYVGIDDRQAMKDAMNYVCRKGYERFIYVCPPLAYKGKTNIFTQEERFAGCLQGLRDNGITEQPIVIDTPAYVEALSGIDFRSAPKTAVVCSCDIYALEVMNHLKERGLRIPEDAGVIGFDNIDVLKYVAPRLTTVEYAVEQFGERAVRDIVGQIEKGSSEHIPLLPYRIIAGSSI